MKTLKELKKGLEKFEGQSMNFKGFKGVFLIENINFWSLEEIEDNNFLKLADIKDQFLNLEDVKNVKYSNNRIDIFYKNGKRGLSIIKR